MRADPRMMVSLNMLSAQRRAQVVATLVEGHSIGSPVGRAGAANEDGRTRICLRRVLP